MSFTASNDHLLVAEVSILSCDFVGRSGGDPPTKSPLRMLPRSFSSTCSRTAVCSLRPRACQRDRLRLIDDGR